MLKVIEIETEVETVQVGLLTIHADIYVCEELKDGKSASKKFWLKKRTDGIPTEEQIVAEITSGYKALKGL